MVKNQMKHSTTKHYSFYILGILSIILVWVLLSHIINSDIILPTPINVLKSLVELLKNKTTYLAIGLTLLKLLIVIVIGVVVAFILSFLAYQFKWFSSYISPLIVMFRTIPVASISIILLMIIGNKNAPYYICLLVIVPILYEGFLSSLKGITKEIIEETKMLSSTSIYVISKVYIPIISPYMVSSIISSFGLGLKVMVMAEYISQTPNTIGYLLNQEKSFLEIDNVFAWTIILIIFMLIIEVILKAVQKATYKLAY